MRRRRRLRIRRLRGHLASTDGATDLVRHRRGAWGKSGHESRICQRSEVCVIHWQNPPFSSFFFFFFFFSLCCLFYLFFPMPAIHSFLHWYHAKTFIFPRSESPESSTTVRVEVPTDNLQSKKKEPQRFIFSSPGFLTIREEKEEEVEQEVEQEE